MDEDFPESETYYTNESYDEFRVNFVEIESMYDRCSISFQSRSALHRYINLGCDALVRRAVEETSSDPPSSRPILRSAAKLSALGSGLAFRGWSYATTLITFDPEILRAISDPDTSVCLDKGYGVSLVDKVWLAKKHLSQKINTMPVPLKVRGIDASRYKWGEFALTALYMPGLDREGSEVYAFVQCELHLVDGLKANMLIKNNIFCSEGFTINLANVFAHILSCGMTIVISARNHSQFLRRNVLANTTIFIPPKSEAFIDVRQIPLPDSRDFLFQPFPQEHLTLYSHLLDHTSSRMLVRNDVDRAIQIPRSHRLGYITEIPFENCFATSVDHDATSTPPTSPLLFHERNDITIPPADTGLETELPNHIKIFGDSQAVEKITRLINEYPSIWESSGFVQMPPERWMKVHFKPGWEAKVSAIKPRVYPLGINSNRLVDKIFDELQRLGCLKFTTSHTPFSFPVFVIWKTAANGEKKGRAVVDIRKLNDLVIPDAYPLPFQSEIIANVQGYTNLAVMAWSRDL